MVTDLIDLTRSRFPRMAVSAIAVEPLEKGGSDRKFYRIRAGETTLILAKYGVQREENRHYVAIARFLSEMGVRVPEIYFHDESEGLIWMEDLGLRDLWSYRDEPWPVRRELYRDALDQALILHSKGHIPRPEPPPLQAEFNAALYRWEQSYFTENCLQRVFGLGAEEIEQRCDRGRLNAIADALHDLPRAFVHRDLQSQNIVIKDGRACFIDFQGMRPGLVQYDLASLLYDPYVRLADSERAELQAYYRAGWQKSDEAGADGEFDVIYLLCAMQRLMQALGAYGYLGLVRERPEFLEHIPAAIQSLKAVVAEIDGLESLAALLESLTVR